MSIPAQTCLPVTPEDLRLCTIISAGSGQVDPYPPCPLPPKPPGPRPPSPKPEPAPPGPKPGPKPKLDYQVSRAFITVNTIAERDKLTRTDLPEGKIVRVNDVDGQPAYFEWDDVAKFWKLSNITNADMSQYYTAKQADETFLSIDKSTEAITAVIHEIVPEMIALELEWGHLD